jgi:hypothetical protein
MLLSCSGVGAASQVVEMTLVEGAVRAIEMNHMVNNPSQRLLLECFDIVHRLLHL